MVRLRWLYKLLHRWLPQNKHRGKGNRPSTWRRGPWMEYLEDRLAPTISLSVAHSRAVSGGRLRHEQHDLRRHALGDLDAVVQRELSHAKRHGDRRHGLCRHFRIVALRRQSRP